LRLRARLLLYGLFGVMTGFWLSMAAVGAVLGSGKPRALIDLAYWPARLAGISLNQYMYPNLVGPIVLNILGWTALAEVVAFAHHWVVAPDETSRDPNHQTDERLG
jgi:hypothetical protein